MVVHRRRKEGIPIAAPRKKTSINVRISIRIGREIEAHIVKYRDINGYIGFRVWGLGIRVDNENLA